MTKKHGNMRRIFKITFWGMLLCSFTPSAAPAEESYLSPTAIVADPVGETLYVAAHATGRILVYDIASRQFTDSYSLPDRPNGLALSPDGTHLHAACGQAQGKIATLNLMTGLTESVVSVGHTPTAPSVRPDGNVLYVCNRFNNDVSIVDLATQQVAMRIPVPREPVASTLTPDGKWLFVANLLPTGSLAQGYAAAAVSVIDTAASVQTAAIQLPNGSTALRGMCTAPDGKYVYVTHVLARYQVPTTQLERGWVNTNAVSIIDVAEKKLLTTVLLDDLDLGAANPWGVTCTSDGKHLCVSHAGTHEISVIDRPLLHQKIAEVAVGANTSYAAKTLEDIPNDLSFLTGIRQRFKLPGNGPRDLTTVGATAFIVEYFSDSLAVVDLSGHGRPAVTSMSLHTSEPTEVSADSSLPRKGEMLFNDATLCFQQWQSCASCHPDGRTDGLNWDLLNDGIGNPKNTKSLLLSHQTPPVMITGVRNQAETAVRAGIRYIQFVIRPDTDAQAIDEYLKSLTPSDNPHLVNGSLSPTAQRGSIVFDTAGCSTCHTPPLHTDMKKYDVGTGSGSEEGREFDTPTLTELWRTAPYLYDGRAATITEVLTTHNQDDHHGQTSNLTPSQLADLTQFLLSQ